MDIVINIPESEYEIIKRSGNAFFATVASKEIMMKSIRNGTPLPKGHGRLIDADALEERMMATSRYFHIKFDIEE